MTGKATPDPPKEEPELARFLQDWTALWREELQAQAGDPEGMAGAMELWRSAMSVWTDTLRGSPLAAAAARDRTRPSPRAEAAAAAPDARDDEVQRLARRVDELEAR